MNPRIKWINHKTKRILFLDYTNLSNDNSAEMYATFDAARDFILTMAGKNILLLVDVHHSFADSKVLARLKEDGKLEKPFIKKEAVIGITGFKYNFVKAINLVSNLGIEVFDDIEKAKDWLVKD